MHETLHNNIKGYIDSKTVTLEGKAQMLLCKGWVFHTGLGVIKLRIYYNSNNEINDEIIDVPGKERKDVSAFYHNFMLDQCGWEFKIPFYCQVKLQGLIDGVWVDIFNFDPYNFNMKKEVCSFVVVDNFYEDPDSVRRYALQQEFFTHPDAHKGCRTDTLHRFEGMKERFESILNCKIKNWDYYGTNCCFQYCIKGDELVYHMDKQEYAGVLFLTPNSPVDSGTTFYKSKATGKMTCNTQEEFDNTFSKGFLDGSQFEVVDVVGNVYNRLVLFNSKMIHAASDYFGTCKEDGRLFQLFFFDLDR